MISPRNNCPTPNSEIPAVLALWKTLAKEQCRGKKVQIIRSPEPILVTSQRFCPNFVQKSGYFSDVAGDFACR